MKKLIVSAVLVAVLAALLAGTVLAAGPVTPAQGFGPGSGVHTPGAGLASPDATCPCGAAAGNMMRRGAPEWAGEPDEVAALLGMTAEQIQAERLAGKSLAQIAAAKGISEDTLISTILDARKADLAALVADGKLTQAQADLMLQNMPAQVKTMVERTNVGPAANQGRTGGMWARDSGAGAAQTANPSS